MTEFDFIQALDAVTWYNGLAPYVLRWLEIKEPFTPPLDKYGMTSEELNQPNSMYVYYQLQIIWMLAVELFSDYGTSPRVGWIEEIEDFYKWILDITALWRDFDRKGDEG